MRTIKGTVNSVELLGWLGSDPDMRFLSSGAPVCRMRIATKRLTRQDESGHREYETDWISVEAWERLAELCNSYLHKGSRVFISGTLRSDSWTDKESNQPRYKTYVRADDVIFLDARPGMPGEAIAASEAGEEQAEDVPF